MRQRERQKLAEILQDGIAFRDAMLRFATTVSIISCACGGCRYGMSATAVTSLSVDRPSLLVCVNKNGDPSRLERGRALVRQCFTEFSFAALAGL